VAPHHSIGIQPCEERKGGQGLQANRGLAAQRVVGVRSLPNLAVAD
jgi:hypothetical protein